MHNQPGPLRSHHHPLELPEALPVRADLDLEVVELAQDPPRYLHYHSLPEIGICTAGAGLFFIGASVKPFGPGDVIAASADELHLARSLGGPSTWTFVQYDESVLWAEPKDVGGPLESQFVKAGREPLLGHVLRRLRQELATKAEGYEPVVRGLLATACALLARHPGEPTPPVTAEDWVSEEFVALLARLARDFAEPLTVGQMAEDLDYSDTHFRRLFKSALGRPPHDYVIHLRVNAARALLSATEDPVSEIAAQCGFPEISTFHRHFKARSGCTPLEYRARSGGDS
jgi:AraC-like DNA-binding protein